MKACHHRLQIVRFRNVIAIELGHEIVVLVSVSIIEVGKIAFLTMFSTGPCVIVITGYTFAAGNRDFMFCTPLQCFDSGIFIG